MNGRRRILKSGFFDYRVQVRMNIMPSRTSVSALATLKEAKRTLRFPGACVVGLLMLVSCHAAIADEARGDVSKRISNLRASVDLAEVYLLPRNIEPRYINDEGDIVRTRCRYVIRNKEDIDSLMSVLADAGLAEVPTTEDGFDGRMVIRLHEGKDRLHTFVLSPDYGNGNARGEYRLIGIGIYYVMPVEAKNRIERDLRFWASQHSALALHVCSG
jgi:hypothetical protein